MPEVQQIPGAGGEELHIQEAFNHEAPGHRSHELIYFGLHLSGGLHFGYYHRQLQDLVTRTLQHRARTFPHHVHSL